MFFIIIYIYTVHSANTNNWRQNYRHIAPITRNKKSKHWCIFICPFPTPALCRMQFWKQNALCRGFALIFSYQRIPTRQIQLQQETSTIYTNIWDDQWHKKTSFKFVLSGNWTLDRTDEECFLVIFTSPWLRKLASLLKSLL